MAVGVAVANAILFVTQAEKHRREKLNEPYLQGIKDRIRPILMTSLAMIAGMIPMALGLGEGGDQTSPLGTAVIGGLIFSMFSSLIVLPLIYQSSIGNRPVPVISLDPDDPASKYHLLTENQS
jgi:multidrug efflux pump subunit AcrB